MKIRGKVIDNPTRDFAKNGRKYMKFKVQTEEKTVQTVTVWDTGVDCILELKTGDELDIQGTLKGENLEAYRAEYTNKQKPPTVPNTVGYGYSAYWPKGEPDQRTDEERQREKERIVATLSGENIPEAVKHEIANQATRMISGIVPLDNKLLDYCMGRLQERVEYNESMFVLVNRWFQWFQKINFKNTQEYEILIEAINKIDKNWDQLRELRVALKTNTVCDISNIAINRWNKYYHSMDPVHVKLTHDTYFKDIPCWYSAQKRPQFTPNYYAPDKSLGAL